MERGRAKLTKAERAERRAARRAALAIVAMARAARAAQQRPTPYAPQLADLSESDGECEPSEADRQWLAGLLGADRGGPAQ